MLSLLFLTAAINTEQLPVRKPQDTEIVVDRQYAVLPNNDLNPVDTDDSEDEFLKLV